MKTHQGLSEDNLGLHLGKQLQFLVGKLNIERLGQSSITPVMPRTPLSLMPGSRTVGIAVWYLSTISPSRLFLWMLALNNSISCVALEVSENITIIMYIQPIQDESMTQSTRVYIWLRMIVNKYRVWLMHVRVLRVSGTGSVQPHLSAHALAHRSTGVP